MHSTARVARITVDGKVPVPVIHPRREARKEFVHRFLIEHVTTNPQVTPSQVATAALEAMRSSDDGWFRARIIEFYEIKQGGVTESVEPPISNTDEATS
jgi:hypothetical protein